MKSLRDIDKTIDEAFSSYDVTVSLVRELLGKEPNIQEVILLTCARLDSMANLAFSERPQRQRFTNFLLRYAPSRDLFGSISVPDLYLYLRCHLYVLPGAIPKPGRLHSFDPDQDKDFMRSIWDSELPITETDIGRFLKYLLRGLSSRYRVVASQSSRRRTQEDPECLLSILADGAENYRGDAYREAVKNLRPVLNGFRLSDLLYREYRCGAVHGHRVLLDEADVFTRPAPYWHPFYNEYIQAGAFLKVQFPGRFLVDTLVDCLSRYKRAWKAQRKLPPGIFFDTCDLLKECAYLDDKSIPEGKDGKWSI